MAKATEPFDEFLDRRIWALNSERVGWDAAVADRRKRVPEGIYGLESDLENRRSAAEWMEEGDEEDVVAGMCTDTGAADAYVLVSAKKMKPKAEDIPPPPRHRETVETFYTVVANLAELASVWSLLSGKLPTIDVPRSRHQHNLHVQNERRRFETRSPICRLEFPYELQFEASSRYTLQAFPCRIISFTHLIAGHLSSHICTECYVSIMWPKQHRFLDNIFIDLSAERIANKYKASFATMSYVCMSMGSDTLVTVEVI